MHPAKLRGILAMPYTQCFTWNRPTENGVDNYSELLKVRVPSGPSLPQFHWLPQQAKVFFSGKIEVDCLCVLNPFNGVAGGGLLSFLMRKILPRHC